MSDIIKRADLIRGHLKGINEVMQKCESTEEIYIHTMGAIKDLSTYSMEVAKVYLEKRVKK